MKHAFTFLFVFSIITLSQSQISNVGTELKSISKELKSSSLTDEGKFDESTDFEIIKDTLYIYQSKGFPDLGTMDEFHYFIKLKDLASVEYKEMTLGEITTYMLCFTSKGNNPSFIFKYGTKDEIYISLKNDPFSEEELQNYTVITLPEIKDKSKYKKLENLIKSLIK